ncbi:unnamed protein product [Didymodactylos carnosus]|uniref:Thioredoxin domain-containing protein n=1 Tax=Didymodactylos carnosus TaxID=1234261 RepID=A0A8S2E5K6_9BILA|nr:unnamed protein product [Didymodactylos carnosus]CAF3890638.1 unnamed protein product [Didymodactylos carnosus]
MSKFQVQLAIFKQSPQSYHLYQLKNPTSIDELIYKCGWSTDDDTDRFKKAIAELNGPGIIFGKKAKDDYVNHNYFVGERRKLYHNGWRDVNSLRSWAFTFLPSKVVELDSAKFSTILLRDNNSWVIDFYAPWCGHCHQFSPILEGVARLSANHKGFSEFRLCPIDGWAGFATEDCSEQQADI